MRFEKGQLIGMGRNIFDDQHVYMVLVCFVNVVHVVNLETSEQHSYLLRGADNFACANEFGTFQELIEQCERLEIAVSDSQSELAKFQ